MSRQFQAQLISPITKKVKETKTLTTRNYAVVSDVKRQLGLADNRTVTVQYFDTGFKLSTHHSKDYWVVKEQVPDRLSKFT